jgi:hypothetical protein
MYSFRREITMAFVNFCLMNFVSDEFTFCLGEDDKLTKFKVLYLLIWFVSLFSGFQSFFVCL